MLSTDYFRKMINETDYKYHECGGTRLYLLEDYLNDNQCKSLIYALKNTSYSQGVVKMPELAQEVWEYIGPKISEQVFFDSKRNFHFRIVNIIDYITVTNSDKPTPIHRDMQLDHSVPYKLVFHLNKISGGGGTIFYDDNKNYDDDERSLVIKNNPGSGVLFDLSLFHKGQDFTAGQTKVVIGARPIINIFK